MHRSSPTKFKNPFELLEEDSESIQVFSSSESHSNQTARKTYQPLPFNPYTIADPIEQKNKDELSTFTHVKTLEFAEERKEPLPPKVYEAHELNEHGDPPLFEDIGIQPQRIKEKIKIILKIRGSKDELIVNSDLSGPLLIGLCLGVLLLFSGKLHFGDIYATFVMGGLLMFFLMNFISQFEIISLYSMMSILGYSLIPMLLLGVLRIFVNLKGSFGVAMALSLALWSSFAAGGILEAIMKGTRPDRRELLVYPLFLFYVSFAMIIIF